MRANNGVQPVRTDIITSFTGVTICHLSVASPVARLQVPKNAGALGRYLVLCCSAETIGPRLSSARGERSTARLTTKVL